MSLPGGAQAKNLAEKFLQDVKSDIGDPYVFGAAGPKEFDCSGLIYYNLRRVGILGVPRTSEAQWHWVQHIHKNQLTPGDLIFMQFPGDQASPGHVVIYAGNGNIIQAPHTGADVQEVPLSSMGNGSEIVGYGRVPGLSGTASPVGSTGGGNNTGALAAGGTLGIQDSPLAGLPQLGQDALGFITGTASTVGDIATVLQGISRSVNVAVKFLAVLGHPSFWLRVAAFFGGLVALGIGVVLLGKSIGINPPPIPVPLPI
jgi:hypothetical protein